MLKTIRRFLGQARILPKTGGVLIHSCFLCYDVNLVTIQLIEIPCPLCGSGSSQATFQRNNFTIVKCRKCDFQFVNPRPPEDLILRAYTSASLDEEISFSYVLNSDHPVEEYYSWTGVYVLNRLKCLAPQGTLLDVGAGQGWAVRQAGEIGWDAYGYEFGDDRAFQSDPELTRRIFKTKSELDKTGMKFDHIFSSAVLEHVYDPQKFFDEWVKYLKPGGLCTFAAIPNMDSIFIRLGLDSWEGNIPPMHLNYFTPKTMSFFAEKNHCQVIDLYTLGAPVMFGPQYIFKQKQFEESYWGTNSRSWSKILTKNTQGSSSRNNPFKRAIAAGANHLLKFLNCGSNVYVTFKVRP
jgi:SAM-dependent methyltransferase